MKHIENFRLIFFNTNYMQSNNETYKVHLHIPRKRPFRFFFFYSDDPISRHMIKYILIKSSKLCQYCSPDLNEITQ